MLNYTISSGNIFQDLGFADAEQKLAKVKLLAVINNIIQKQNISEKKLAKIFNLNSTQVDNLLNGRLKEFSLDKLLLFLMILEQNIEIIVTPKPQEFVNSRINVVS